MIIDYCFQIRVNLRLKSSPFYSTIREICGHFFVFSQYATYKIRCTKHFASNTQVKAESGWKAGTKSVEIRRNFKKFQKSYKSEQKIARNQPVFGRFFYIPACLMRNFTWIFADVELFSIFSRKNYWNYGIFFDTLIHVEDYTGFVQGKSSFYIGFSPIIRFLPVLLRKTLAVWMFLW